MNKTGFAMDYMSGEIADGAGFKKCALCMHFNPFDAEATFLQNTRMQRFLKTI